MIYQQCGYTIYQQCGYTVVKVQLKNETTEYHQYTFTLIKINKPLKIFYVFDKKTKIMKKTIHLLLILLTFTLSNAQEIDESKNFIYKTDGSIVYGKHLSYKTPVFKENYFDLDSLKIKSKNVKFYKFGEDFFGSIQEGRSSFARRTIKGKINYYTLTNIHYAAPIPNAGGFGGMTSGTTTTNNSYYYNTDYNSLKVANYENLSIDLQSNSESIVYLKKYHNAKKKRTIAYVLGGIAMVAGILTAAEKTGETTNSFNPNTGNFETSDVTKLRPVNLAIGLIGFGTIVTTIISSKKKKQYIQKAIEVYNEN